MKPYSRGFSHVMRKAGLTKNQPPQEQMNPTTAVAAKPKVALTIKDRIQGDEFRKAVAHVLPKHLTPDRFVRIAIMAITRTPKLAECDQASFFGALMTLSQLGLEPDGRRAHLIPFRNTKRNCMECQLIVDWKGLAELAMRSGMVSYLHADIVSDGDLFEYDMGRVVKHVPWFLRRDESKPQDPGDVIAAYAFAEFKDGTRKAEVLSIREVEGIRARSKSADSGPWVTDWSEMAKKTAFRRLSKWLPLSPEFRDAVDKDDEASGITTTVEDLQHAPVAVRLNQPAPTFEIEPPTTTEADEIPGAETPEKQPEATPEPPTTKPAPNSRLDGLRKFFSEAGISEGALMALVRVRYPETDSLAGLDDVEAIAPHVINGILRTKAGWVAEIRAGTKDGSLPL